MKKPTEYVQLFRSLGNEWKWLLRYASRYRLQIALYVVIGIVSTAMGLGSSVATKYLIDSVVSHNDDTILRNALIAVGLSLSQIIVGAVISRIVAVVGTKISSEIRSSIYEHITYSKWENIRKFHSGDLLNRIEGDVASVSNSIITYIPGIFTKGAQFVGCLAVVLYYDPTMAIFAFLSAPFLVISSKITMKMIRKYNKESREMNGRILSFYSESIQNLQTIKAFDITKRYVDQMKTNLQLHRKIKLDHDRFTIAMSLCMSVIGLVVAYSCYGWGVYRLWQGAISYGTMTLFLQISGQLTGSFSSLVSLVPGAISIATAAGRIMEITDLPLEENKNDEQAQKMEKSANENGVTIVCDNLKYTYPDGDEPVVGNATFRAEPGETIAFVGPSGEGKTTLLRLILGLVEPDSGTLSVETKDGIKIPVSESTRRFCSYVPQGNAVFSGTVADNLRIVRPEAADDEIIAALRVADAWSFVEELPLGINTVISEKGVNFSEGQVQRISIARAILRDAPIIVMDEATSALDAETEARVVANMMNAYPNRTRIITTHRPAMLRYCTRVYSIEKNGRLVEISEE
ncbi:MAG: ABC transporter ATP-binding protein [Clostridia bacterium]|nr:ABC transporter ATP-binding protein [Clostridia bacterium]